MSTIGTVEDKIYTVLASILDNQVELPNPYALEDNSNLHLNGEAYGVTVDPGINTERNIGCLASWEQSYTIVLTRRIITTPNNLSVRKAIARQLEDDCELIFKAFEANPTLDGVTAVAKVLGHGGIQFLNISNNKYLALFINLTAEHQLSIP